MVNSIREKTFSNMFWRFAERSAAQIIQFIVSIVLARILIPEAYGTVAIVLAIIQILQVFVDSGFANALIQKKNADDIDFSSVFYFNMSFCIVLYIVVFLLSPLIALFYNKPELTALIRVSSILIIISGTKNVQQAYVSRNLQFKKFFYATLGGTIASAVVGILIALLDGGAWAIVAQKLTNATVDTIVLWFTVGWKPKKLFSFERLKRLFGFGSRLLIVSIMNSIYINLRQLVIGKVYAADDLAHYNQGNQLPNALISNINTAIDSVLLPVMSNEQDNIMRVREMTRKSIKIGTFIIAPMMFGLAGAANNVVRVLLTDKWIPCIPFMRVFCICFLFYPISTANYNAVKALGRSEIYLKVIIIQKIIDLICLIISMWISPFAIACGALVSTVIDQLVISWPNRKLLNYRYRDLVMDIAPSFVLSFVMGLLVYFVGSVETNIMILLILQIVVGVIIYWLGAKLFKIDSYQYLVDTLKPVFLRIKKRHL